MCGFAGFLIKESWSYPEEATSVLDQMISKIAPRGPDDQGIWLDQSGVGLAHRRLAILDLSSAGHQPMTCFADRFVIVFNGEIYNHLDIRKDLERAGHLSEFGWRGHSDTETLLAGFGFWGIPETVERCVGMFAFAVWDKKEKLLTLGRDRIGEKPLYYGWQGSGSRAQFLFGSELSAFHPHPVFERQIDSGALALYLRHNYIPDPYSIYSGIRKLEPGSLLTLSRENPTPRLETYWSSIDVAIRGASQPFDLPKRELIDNLEDLLLEAVGGQMISDVPLGAFLSGGIDSSTIVALMQAQSGRPIKTFTVGFAEERFNEAVHAKEVARHLGTDHTELYVTPDEVQDVIPLLPDIYSEPFADSSQIPTFLISVLARRDVTVALSGDAGDELFGGYNRYLFGDSLWRRISRTPLAFRSLASKGLTAISPQSWDRLADPFQYVLPRRYRQSRLGDKVHKGASVLSCHSLDELYRKLVSQWEPRELMLSVNEPETMLSRPSLFHDLAGVERMMAMDLVSYLPGDILVKVDRAAMGVSLETRVPLLDHRVIEFAWQIPMEHKIHGGVTKSILREVLYRHVPRDLIDRPKMGFGIPIDAWLRGPLIEWVESLISEDRLKADGFFEARVIREKWNEHLSGRRNWAYGLWTVLMFQSWLTRWSN